MIKKLTNILTFWHRRIDNSVPEQENSPVLAESRGEIFEKIFNSNIWGNEESVSGNGSTLAYTENLRKELPKLVSKYGIRSILDAPCGDFNWMKHVLAEIDVTYIGADIVKPLIDSLNSKHHCPSVEFKELDLVNIDLPNVDLIISRDFLFHLSFTDIRTFLNNYVKSESLYLLTTSHLNDNVFSNKDISTGDFRLIDLFSHPFHFPSNCLERIDDWVESYPPRQMCLFDRSQVIHALSTLK